MRQSNGILRFGTSAPPPRALSAGVPALIVGSIALSLTASPTHAAEATRDAAAHLPRTLAPVIPASLPVVRMLPTANTPQTHTVQRGDTVSSIAARYGLRTVDVLTLNGLSWKSIIYPGQVLVLAGGAAAAAPAPAPAPVAAAAVVDVVRAGDTISAIARRNGVSIAAVFSANGLGWSSIIYPGQKIAIPGAAAPTPAPAPAPAAPPAMVPVAATGAAYTIRAGDTISAIAQRHGVTTAAVLSANGLSRASIIYPGQTLTIPGAAAAPAPASAPAPAPAPAASVALDAEQSANAQLIIGIGRELGVPERGIAIALGTAMQESWLRNLDWGDRDSLGLFQQRPSTGWGTDAEVRDAARATRAFYGGASDPNGYRTRGLLDIPGWQGMTYAQAAQAVQISAYPDRYAQWEQPSFAWLAALG